MKIEILNPSVQGDLYEILNTHPYNITIHREDDKLWLISQIDEDTSIQYPYISESDILKDLETLKNVMIKLDTV